MKYSILISFFAFSVFASCQIDPVPNEYTQTVKTESKLSTLPDSIFNNLLYPRETMIQLESIVDSLNEEFQSCEVNNTYKSEKQAEGYFIRMTGRQIIEAIKLMDEGIEHQEFVSRFSSLKQNAKVFILKDYVTSYSGEKQISFKMPLINQVLKFEKDEKLESISVKGKWLYKVSPKTKWSDKSLSAIYFQTDLNSHEIPKELGRLIQYADCLIDTNSVIFNGDLDPSSDRPEAVDDFLSLIHKKTNRPKYSDFKDFDEYHTHLEKWDSVKMNKVRQFFEEQPEIQEMLIEALNEALVKGGSNDEFEDFVYEFHSKEMALELKRKRRVYGSCSMDDSPIWHATEIAKLSAETNNWEVFLRAHLNIMNDRFSRMSDGSYAWAQRHTYSKELELLSIDTESLILGISLRFEDSAPNHYFGSISRLGRSIAELENHGNISQKMLAAIANERLDNYNRFLMIYLYLNYVSYLEDQTEVDKKLDALKDTKSAIPDYIYDSIQSDIGKLYSGK